MSRFGSVCGWLPYPPTNTPHPPSPPILYAPSSIRVSTFNRTVTTCVATMHLCRWHDDAIIRISMEPQCLEHTDNIDHLALRKHNGQHVGENTPIRIRGTGPITYHACPSPKTLYGTSKRNNVSARPTGRCGAQRSVKSRARQPPGNATACARVPQHTH